MAGAPVKLCKAGVGSSKRAAAARDSSPAITASISDLGILYLPFEARVAQVRRITLFFSEAHLVRGLPHPIPMESTVGHYQLQQELQDV